jgi:ketosteroid isomerase-like protein
MMISGGRPPLVGKQALVDAMNRVFARSEIDETWAPEETIISGDLAYQRGTYVVVATPKAGGEPTRSTGIFTRIYRRQSDGSWLMTRDVLNRD